MSYRDTEDGHGENADTSNPSCDSGTSPPGSLCLPYETDPGSLRLRWWWRKKGKWGDCNGKDFSLCPAVVLDEELRELGHDYWSEGPNKCPALAKPNAGICPQDLKLAEQMLALKDAEGLPIVEIRGVDGIAKLGWSVSEDSLALVCWYRTAVPSGECVDDCDERFHTGKCRHEKSTEPTVRRVAQGKLLCGRWGRWQKRPGDTPDESGLARHYEWVDDPNPPDGYRWHRGAVGACAWVDLSGGCELGRALVTEGLKKGLVAYLRGLPVVVLASVTLGGTGRRGRLEDIVAGGHGRPELDDHVLDLIKKRRVIWAFDADIVTKEPVLRALASSMASAKTKVKAEPEFLLFPKGGPVKGALDSVLLAAKDRDASDVLRGALVSLGSLESLKQWLAGDRAADVVAVASAYFRELKARGGTKQKPLDALRALVLSATGDAERARELLAAHDPRALKTGGDWMDAPGYMVAASDDLPGVAKRNGDKEPYLVTAEPINIIETGEDEAGNLYVAVRWSYAGKLRTETVQRKDVYGPELLELANRGAPVNQQNKGAVQS
ncbi:MAG: hypothetical protein ACYC8T_27665, partial [Myxococcaceae bacterium]